MTFSKEDGKTEKICVGAFSSFCTRQAPETENGLSCTIILNFITCKFIQTERETKVR